MSKNKIVTKEDQIGFIFGRPLDTLPEDGGKFSELDIVRHYIYHFDGIRGSSFHVKQGLRNKIVNCLIDSLLSTWHGIRHSEIFQKSEIILTGK